MNKLWLIIRREYLTRVKKRSFILTTILTPVILVAFFIIVGFIFSYEGEKLRIAVANDSGIDIVVSSTSKTSFIEDNTPLEDLKTSYKDKDYDGVLHIPEFKNLNNELHLKYYSDKQLSLTLKEVAESKIAKQVRNHKIKLSGITEAQLKELETEVKIDEMAISMSEDGTIEEQDKTNSSAVATAIGGFLGFLIYIILFIYGSQVMRSVMEEKMNRIVEVMISSVKPFQLMLGKIIGVGGVGLTQSLIWIILLVGLNFIAGLFFQFDTTQMEEMTSTAANSVDPEDMYYEMMEVWQMVMQQNWGLIIPLFIIYFLGGYILYSSLFAAVGSAIGDDLGESQSLTLPITIPVILAIYIMFAVINNPNSSLATWASIFPLFSPIVMPARLAFNPPWWEIALSVGVLIASVLFFVWISGRIYRVGILMYGKKVTFKELGKWLFYKD